MGKETEMQIKALETEFEIKAQEGSDDALHVKAYACVFNNVDSYDDIILPNALDNFMKSEDADRMRLCYQHSRYDVIGVITDKGVDTKGMWIEADVLPTTLGKDVQVLLKSGAINELSVGYRCNDYVYNEKGIRMLKDISVSEVSFVTRAANPLATVTSMKSAGIDSESVKRLSDDELKQMADTISNEQYRRLLSNL